MTEIGVYGLLLVGLLGLCVGSFLNVVIYRVPKRLSALWERDSRDFLGIQQPEKEEPTPGLAFPPSHCPKCGSAISPLQNIPVISYLFLRGKCAACAAPISLQYPLVELFSALFFVAAYSQFGLTVAGGFTLAFCLLLLVLTGIDFQTQLLPDNLTYPLLWLGLIANTMGLYTDLTSAVFGAVAGYLVLWCVYWGFKLLTGKEGMGYGDFKLLAALGAWLGWQQLPLIILLSSLIGAIVGGIMIALASQEKQQPIAFGPYLAMAGLVAMFWGDAIVALYFNSF